MSSTASRFFNYKMYTVVNIIIIYVSCFLASYLGMKSWFHYVELKKGATKFIPIEKINRKSNTYFLYMGYQTNRHWTIILFIWCVIDPLQKYKGSVKFMVWRDDTMNFFDPLYFFVRSITHLIIGLFYRPPVLFFI